MKKRILQILAFMILVSFNACTSKPAVKQDISIMYTQDTSKLSIQEKNQTIIIRNQKEMIKNQEILLTNQEIVLNNQKNIIDSTQQEVIQKVKSIITNTQIYAESMYIQLEKTGEALKIQQKQIDSLIIIKIK